MALSDGQLVERVRGGNREAFGSLVDRYRDMVYGLGYHLTRDFEAARDLAQEAFVQAYLRLDQLRDPEKFAGWLRQIATNIHHNLHRRRDVATVALQDIDQLPDTGRPSEIDLVVREALGRLREPERLALTLHYINGYSYAEIGSFLSVRPETVKTRLARARQHLRTEVMAMVEDAFERRKLPDAFTDKTVGAAWRLDVQHDARVFTASVFLNLTGYNEENAPAFHPVRARLREEMRAAVPVRLVRECQTFRDEHPSHWTAYLWLAMLTGGPPRFDLAQVETAAASPFPVIAEHVRRTVRELGGFCEPLRKLWEVSTVREACDRIRPEALAHGEAHARLLQPNVVKAIAYMRADPAALLARYTVIMNLPSSYWWGMAIPIGMHFYEIRGPVTETPGAPDPHAIGDAHEFVHMLVAPTSWDAARVEPHAVRLGGLFRRAQSYRTAPYDSFIVFMNECLVDAVSSRVREGPVPLAPLQDPDRPQVMEDARAGQLMAPWFYEHLEAYERGTLSFGEWFDQTMAATTTDAVLERLGRLGVIV